MALGTFSLLIALRQHWKRPIHPVYTAESRYGAPWRGADRLWARHGGLFTNVILIALGIALFSTVARILTDQAVFWLLSNLMLQAIVLLIGSLLALVLIVLIWLWPLAVAVASSSTIVRDREQRTWAALLTTPIAWGDLLTVKLASTLRWFNRPLQLLFWVQSVFLTVGIIIAAGQLERLAGIGSPLLAVLVTALAGAQFAVGRVQDYAMACLIGLTASLNSEARQTAAIYALFGSIGLVLGRIALTAALLLTYPVPSPQAALLLLATGPTTTLILTSSLPLIIVLLIGMPLVREIIIRAGYRWVLAHLGMVIGG